MTRKNGVHSVLTLNERDVARACDSLIEQLGGQIVRLEQRRASHIALGLPDRRYRYRGVAFWFELKAENGRLMWDQYQFLRAEYDCGSVAGAGGLEELRQIIDAIRDPRGDACGMGRHQVEILASLGFRGEPKPKHRAAQREPEAQRA